MTAPDRLSPEAKAAAEAVVAPPSAPPPPREWMCRTVPTDNHSAVCEGIDAVDAAETYALYLYDTNPVQFRNDNEPGVRRLEVAVRLLGGDVEHHVLVRVRPTIASAELLAPAAPATATPQPARTDGCLGVDAVVELRHQPSTLVDCPECGRRGLGGVNVRDGFSEVRGYARVATVPFHRPTKATRARTRPARFGVD